MCKKTHFEVNVYSCKAHWGNLLDELTEEFENRWQAELYAKVIAKYNPEYRIEICECGTGGM